MRSVDLRSVGVLLLLTVCLTGCGPRMRIQPAVKPYEQQMPDMPAGTVPTRGRLMTFTREQANRTANPLPRTPQNLRNGRIYYGYYCVQCHGKDGRSNEAVGQSFVPKPANLTSTRIQGLPDGQIYYRMLHGIGHDPVMDQTVLPQHRWALVMYVKSL